jgi:hypothetical protein
MKIFTNNAAPVQEISGSGHHCIDYVGVARAAAAIQAHQTGEDEAKAAFYAH